MNAYRLSKILAIVVLIIFLALVVVGIVTHDVFWLVLSLVILQFTKLEIKLNIGY